VELVTNPEISLVPTLKSLNHLNMEELHGILSHPSSLLQLLAVLANIHICHCDLE